MNGLIFSIVCNIVDSITNDQYVRTDIKWNADLRDNFRRGLISKLPAFNAVTENVTLIIEMMLIIVYLHLQTL